jgi:hypothetical protein
MDSILNEVNEENLIVKIKNVKNKEVYYFSNIKNIIYFIIEINLKLNWINFREI